MHFVIADGFVPVFLGVKKFPNLFGHLNLMVVVKIADGFFKILVVLGLVLYKIRIRLRCGV
jgi:hypothetical protein